MNVVTLSTSASVRDRVVRRRVSVCNESVRARYAVIVFVFYLYFLCVTSQQSIAAGYSSNGWCVPHNCPVSWCRVMRTDFGGLTYVNPQHLCDNLARVVDNDRPVSERTHVCTHVDTGDENRVRLLVCAFVR
jgi:hypothetical protein